MAQRATPHSREELEELVKLQKAQADFIKEHGITIR